MRIAAIILVIIRLLGVAYAGMLMLNTSTGGNIAVGVTLLVIAALYLVSAIGLFKRNSTAMILLLIVSALDLIAALMLGGTSGLGAGIFDVIVGALAFVLYKQFKRKAIVAANQF